MERTLCIIKPDAVAAGNTGNIIAHIQKEGFRILGMKMVALSHKAAAKFYEVHKGRPFYDGLVDFMSSAPCVPIALERDNAISEWRRVIGATDPAEAAAGTIRKLYAKNKGENAVHGSDSVENGLREIAFFFTERELADLA
ncbi:MAG: nucleoside-diphosphate kinase [Bacteroidota bacterium]|nr:nucleoside-diphosphate kinase [Bacteroidota bacterium]MDP4234608.1 nucleoside-diphosphate kinase [Bacteroidota bacterium]MDP4243793.1 nucleoside-diphosphate kinase [Bacteroidota bacterium]MDP4288969.1 nucleoside-diphosphate kinase [Bacteroidota bacterium]